MIYTLSLHDALPISISVTLWPREESWTARVAPLRPQPRMTTFMTTDGILPLSRDNGKMPSVRSEEHTSELQSHSDLVCRLLLEKKKKKKNITAHRY